MAVIDQLASFADETRLENIPHETVTFAKYLIAKIIASMIKGAQTDCGKRLVGFIQGKEGSSQSTGLIGCGSKTNLEDATFANGLFAHAAELEDDQFPSSTSDITVVPVVMSMTDRFDLTGKQVLESTIVGQELLNRIGMYPLASNGFVELPFYGVIGACIAGCKALNLPPDKLKGAVGIAMGRSSGLISNFGTDAHYIESALACRDGLLAAQLAGQGMAGNPDLENWLRNLLGSPTVDLSEIVKDLGKWWRIRNMWIKKYPCCFITHRPIDILLALMKEDRIHVDDVSEILIDDGPTSAICDRPDPIHTDDARFSFQHSVAAALLDHEVDSRHFDTQSVFEDRFVHARKKIRIVLHDDWPKEFLSGICKTTVTFKDGREISGEMKTALGAPDSPLSNGEVYDLFRRILTGVLDGKDIDWVWEKVMSLEKEDDLKPLMTKIIDLK